MLFSKNNFGKNSKHKKLFLWFGVKMFTNNSIDKIIIFSIFGATRFFHDFAMTKWPFFSYLTSNRIQVNYLFTLSANVKKSIPQFTFVQKCWLRCDGVFWFIKFKILDKILAFTFDAARTQWTQYEATK